jgi:hypothetical protein
VAGPSCVLGGGCKEKGEEEMLRVARHRDRLLLEVQVVMCPSDLPGEHQQEWNLYSIPSLLSTFRMLTHLTPASPMNKVDLVEYPLFIMIGCVSDFEFFQIMEYFCCFYWLRFPNLKI